MKAEELIQKMRDAGIGCDEDRIAREWNMNQSQATDEYMAKDEAGRQAIADAAIQHTLCGFCGAKPGTACSVIVAYNKPPLDHLAHCGRWMKYLIERNSLDDLFAPAATASDDLSDLIG